MDLFPRPLQNTGNDVIRESKTYANKIENELGLATEDTVWEKMGERKIKYAMENDFSCFGDFCKTFNWGKLTRDDSLIHKDLVPKCAGINTPYVYVGTPFTVFALHLEDGNLCAINYLLASALMDCMD